MSLSRQCRLLDFSGSSLYYRPKGESEETLTLVRGIDELFLKYPFYGSRQIVRHLRREGLRVGRDRVRRLIGLMGIAAIYRAPRTSKPYPGHKVYPYLVKGLQIEKPDHVWCADITYIRGRSGFLYLAAVRDWASRRVLSWRHSNTLNASFCVEALEDAMGQGGSMARQARRRSHDPGPPWKSSRAAGIQP